MTKEELFAEVIKEKGWYKKTRLKRSTAIVYKCQFLKGNLNERRISKILRQIEDKKLNKATAEGLFAEIIQEKTWYKDTSLKKHTAYSYKDRFLKGTLDEKKMKNVLKQLGYNIPSNKKTYNNATKRELFAEIIQERTWYKDTNIRNYTASRYKTRFLDGRLEDYIIDDALEQLGYYMPANKKKQDMTTKGLFNEIVKKRMWYKDLKFSKYMANVYKARFLKGELNEGIISKMLEQLGYEKKWIKKENKKKIV